ncbi:hypothetical protein [Paenibacillus sp. FSL M7-1046]|uniref:hypothetical protein n=1 Tax=Paenibacillus sp. FSL M7-1046 TaxID=2975315 RepID=UPI0030F93C81
MFWCRYQKTSPSWGEVLFYAQNLFVYQGLRLMQNAHIKIFVHYEKGITYCYPNDECDEMEITENEWPVVISKTAAPSDSFRLAVVWL